MSSSVLVTGANRGLGLELARQYAEAGWRVHAACRDPAEAAGLASLAGAHPRHVAAHRLDVTEGEQVRALARALDAEAIDVLVNNAGVGDWSGFGAVDYEAWARAFAVNAMGPMRLVEAFVEHVARSERRVVVNVTSLMGSMGDNGSGGYYAYRSSKAALNAVTKSLAIDLKPRGIVVVALHPGWVRTDMGGPNAPLEAPESVRGMRAVIERLTPADSGKFLDHEGDELPW